MIYIHITMLKKAKTPHGTCRRYHLYLTIFPASHIAKDKTNCGTGIIFKEGNVLVIEDLGLIESTGVSTGVVTIRKCIPGSLAVPPRH